MKIYFAGSITGGRQDQEKYKHIIKHLSGYGQVLTEHVGFDALADYSKDLTEKDIYTVDTNWLRESDVLVAEVTQVSMGVGYELAFAESLGKRVICFFNKNSGKRLSAMIRGNDYFEIHDYSELSEVESIIDDIFKNQE